MPTETTGRAVEPDGWILYANPPVRGRSCGACKTCCTLIPVDAIDLQKPANVTCQHVCSKGCRIYEHRPEPCVYWSCRWLIDPDTAALRRPDQAGYVIDPARETINVNKLPIEAVQVFVDPARPDAHRDPALRAYLALLGKRFKIPTLVRWFNQEGGDALLLIPPALRADGLWHEERSPMVARQSMTTIEGKPNANG
jgi:hypothetical protein